MKWISVKDRLPEPKKYVLARHNLENHIDSNDQENVNCVVVALELGLSLEDRAKMISGEIPDYDDSPGWNSIDKWHTSKRSITHKSADEGYNNHKPYRWRTFGPISFFGQEIDYWMEIPKLNIN